MRPWFVLICALLVTACLPQNIATPNPVVETTVEAFVEPTATPDCIHAEGVTLDVRRISDTGVELHARGLQPGEIPFVIHSTSISGVGGMSGESGKFVEGADGQGEFVYELKGLIPLEGETSATWDIRFIHARGVECAIIILP